MLFLKKYRLCLEVLKSNFLTFSNIVLKINCFLNICNFIENLKCFEMIQTKLKLFVCSRELFRDAFCILRKCEGYTIEKKNILMKRIQTIVLNMLSIFCLPTTENPTPPSVFMIFFLIREGEFLLSSHFIGL